MNRYRSLGALLCAAVLSSCDAFEKTAVQQIAAPVPAGARIRFFNFGVNAPGVNFYANDVKMTAISSTTGQESTLGVAYGAVGLGGFYSAIEPGQYTFTGRIAAAVDKNLSVSSITATLENGKHYSVFQSGFYNTTAKTVDGFIVEDNFAAQIDYGVAFVRFVNAISNSSPMTLYARNTTTASEVAVGAAVAYKGAGVFTPLTPGVYDLNTRLTGSTANAITRTAVSFLAGRVYTIGARGDMTVTSTTATNRPFLDNTANR